MNKTKKGSKEPMSQKKKLIFSILSAVLAAALVLGVIFAVAPKSPTALKYGSNKLRENEYSYWFACAKYHYLVSVRGLEDTPEGWAKQMADGVSYDSYFKEAIDREIAMRFVAASLFDASGATLSDTDRLAVENAATELLTYTYGEDAHDYLKDTYGIDAKIMKRIGIYEVKYQAYMKHLFGSDYSGIYAVEYREEVDAFYRANYARYSVIYLSDEKSGEKQTDLEAKLAEGMTEADFTAFAKAHSENKAMENYPNGIYLYASADYSDVFSKELLEAIAEAKTAGAYAVRRDVNDKGSYYVMRYALDDAPYLSEDTGVARSLSGFAQYASLSVYRGILEEALANVKWKNKVTDGYTMAAVTKEMKYNIVRSVR